MILLRAQHVSKTFHARDAGRTAHAHRQDADPVAVLSDVQVTLRSGEVVAVVGPSGIGKSTLLKLCAGVVPADVGNGSAKATIEQAPDTRLVWQPQSAPLVGTRSVLSNVSIGARAAGLSRPEATAAAKTMLDLVGLTDWSHARPSVLSGGMKQRVVLARTLSALPRIALLDEPFSSLDPVLRRRLACSLSEYVTSEDAGIVMVTHTIEEAIDFAHRIYVLNGRPGRVTLIAAKDSAHVADDAVNDFTELRVSDRRGELFEHVSEAMLSGETSP